MIQKVKSTKEQIVTYLSTIWPSSAKQITEHFWFNQTIIHRHLKDLVEAWLIHKTWSVPRVLYIANTNHDKTVNQDFQTKLQYQDIKRLDENYMSYDSDGTHLVWHHGFFIRCSQRWVSIDDQYKKYHKLVQNIDDKRDRNGMLNTLPKLTKQTKEVYLDWLYVCDSYQIGHFWKTTLWSLAFYAKQSQNRQLIDQVVGF